MKRIYADETLEISKEPFKKPENLSIEIDCDEYEKSQGNDPLKGTNQPNSSSNELDML